MENAVCISSLSAGKNTMDESSDAYHMPNDHHLYGDPHFNNAIVVEANDLAIDEPLECKADNSSVPMNAMQNERLLHERGELNKIVSFGMNKEIGKDCDDSLMTSGTYWNDIKTEMGDERITSLSHYSHYDPFPVSPFLEDQLVSLPDYPPEWTFSGGEEEVLVGNTDSTNLNWSCMSGEREVPAEHLSTNAIRCQAPAHAAGQTPLHITKNNRSPCSDARELEFRDHRPGETFSSASVSGGEDGICFQVRFERMISLGPDIKLRSCAIENCEKCNLMKQFSFLHDITEWDKVEEDSRTLQGSSMMLEDLLVQRLLKEKLYKWLVYEAHDEGRGLNVWDEGGQGIIHLAAALGYQWAMMPIVTVGASLSFRDVQGRTGLHWAACYGREETVLELVKLGVDHGAVDSPTSANSRGQTAADLAWTRGHRGIARYLSGINSTGHPSKLASGESMVEMTSANVTAEYASEELQRQMTGPWVGEGGNQSVGLRSSDLGVTCRQGAMPEPWRNRQFMRTHGETSESSVSGQNSQDHCFNNLPTVTVNNQQKHHGYRVPKDFLKVQNQSVKKQKAAGVTLTR